VGKARWQQRQEGVLVAVEIRNFIVTFLTTSMASRWPRMSVRLSLIIIAGDGGCAEGYANGHIG